MNEAERTCEVNQPINCSWCKTVNDVNARWCKKCCHSALHPREECDCRSCLGLLFMDTAADRPSPATSPAVAGSSSIVKSPSEETHK